MLTRRQVLWLLLAGPALARTPGRTVPLPHSKIDDTRELGGIAVAGGRVRTGMIYRSGNLCTIVASAAAQTAVQALGLRTIVDFRTSPEVAAFGSDPAALTKGVTLVHVAIAPMIGASGYRRYVGCRAQIGQFFHLLARPESYPLLFHCHDGKDRTGVMTALLLEVLGASRKDIVNDYLDSRPLAVQQEWLEAALTAVDQAGGVDKLLIGCGVRNAELASIRALLVAKG